MRPRYHLFYELVLSTELWDKLALSLVKLRHLWVESNQEIVSDEPKNHQTQIQTHDLEPDYGVPVRSDAFVLKVEVTSQT